ncbi:uncharacterized protein L201_006801 [Kwoniella dendrophila CBS 6074]|uniref:Major facilitator superfamily (MFS) profile domain-containing protein n=1 Tax=Kwoniella dendrophila CBS 6074 TaxID=1295534 RepID=A0AAX4K420_9TREE
MSELIELQARRYAPDQNDTNAQPSGQPAGKDEEIETRSIEVSGVIENQTQTAEDGTSLEPRPDAPAFDAYPDGGLAAWLQIFYCFCFFFTTLGGIYAWGIFQDALHAAHVAPTSTLAFIGSSQGVLEGLLAIPISALVVRFGNRNVGIVGAILSGLGPILAGFCSRSVPGLLITEGLVFGFGQALCFFCAATLPSSYFLRKRNLATGLVYAGSGIGGAVISVIANGLIKSVGIPWAFRTLGLMFMAINLPCAILLKPRPDLSPVPQTADKGKRHRYVNLTLLKDIRFVLVLFGCAVALPPFFLPIFATSIGLSSGAASGLLAGFNLASACGRIGWGFMADRWLGSLNSLYLCLAMNAISTLVIWPIAGDVGPLALFAVVNGFCAGGFFSLIPGVVSSTFTDIDLPVAFSMIISFFLGAPIGGYLLQAFGGPDTGYQAYRPAIFYAGGLSALSALMIFGVRLKQGGNWRRKV